MAVNLADYIMIGMGLVAMGFLLAEWIYYRFPPTKSRISETPNVDPRDRQSEIDVLPRQSPTDSVDTRGDHVDDE